MAQDKISFTPDLLPESGKHSYRFTCPGPGMFQCALTGLVFVMVQEAELRYKTVIHEGEVIQSSGKMKASLLFKVSCFEEDAVSHLHLPHCETPEALLVTGLLSVVHYTDDGMSVLEPVEVTDTHVVVKVLELNANFGVMRDVRKFMNTRLRFKARSLLYLRPLYAGHRVLDVILVPANVPLNEVTVRQRGCDHISVSSDCELTFGGTYTVLCEPKSFFIQPEDEPLHSDYGPNYHPTFEMFLDHVPEKLTVMVRENQEKREVWRQDVCLSGVAPWPREHDHVRMGPPTR